MATADFQLNIQELQTVKHHNLGHCHRGNEQFQLRDHQTVSGQLFGSRYDASRNGYSTPDFKCIAKAYGFDYARSNTSTRSRRSSSRGGPIVIEVVLSEETLDRAKARDGTSRSTISFRTYREANISGNRYVEYPRPEQR